MRREASPGVVKAAIITAFATLMASGVGAYGLIQKSQSELAIVREQKARQLEQLARQAQDLQQRIEGLESQLRAANARGTVRPIRDCPPSIDAQGPVFGAAEQTAYGVRFRVDRCQRQDQQTVWCFFSASSVKNNETVSALADTFIVDPNGVERVSSRVVFGGDSGTHWANATAIEGVPVRGHFEFGGIDRGVKQISVLNAVFSIAGQQTAFSLQFKDVPVISQ